MKVVLILLFSLTGIAGVLAQSPASPGAPAAPATPAQLSQGGLSLARARGLFASSITATGRIQSLSEAKIGPRVSGRLAEFGRSQTGQPLDVGMAVKQGDILFRLDQTTFRNNLEVAEAQLDSARAVLANLTAPTRPEKMEQLKQDLAQLQARVADRSRERERYKRLVEEEKTLPLRRLEEVEVELISLTAQQKAAEARLAEAEHGPTATEIAVASARVKESEAAAQIARNDLKDSTVLAPFDGTITRRLKGVGDYCVNVPPTDVVELVNVQQLEAEVAVPESYMRSIAPGKTQLTLRSSLLERPLSLPVTRVVDQIDVSRGTFAVRVAIPADQRGALVPGSFITCDLPLTQNAGGVIAPARAIAMQQGKPFVYVARDGKMMRQAVQLGDTLSEGVIITAGVKEGEQIVLGPAQQLADGTQLPEYLRSQITNDE